MMIQELEEGKSYYLDLIDDEMAINALRVMMF